MRGVLFAVGLSFAAFGAHEARAADLPVKQPPPTSVKLCSLFGGGFIYIPSTATCAGTALPPGVGVTDPVGNAGLTGPTMVDFTRSVSSAIGDDGTGNDAPIAPPVSNYAPTDSPAERANAAFASLQPAGASNSSGLWAKAFGGYRTQDSKANSSEANTAFYGGVMGVDRAIDGAWRFGFFAGAGSNQLDTNYKFYNATTTVAFAGLRARYEQGPHILHVALHGGWLGMDSSRIATVTATGTQNANSDTHGWYISPEISYGYRVARWGSFSLTPTARLRYIATMLDGYTETGSLANLTVGHRTINDLEERFDLTLAEVHSVAPGRTIETRARFGGLSYQRLGSDTIDVTLLGQQLSFATPGQRDVSGGYSSFGMSMHMQDGLSFFFDGEGYLMNDRSRIAIGKGGLRHTF